MPINPHILYNVFIRFRNDVSCCIRDAHELPNGLLLYDGRTVSKRGRRYCIPYFPFTWTTVTFGNKSRGGHTRAWWQVIVVIIWYTLREGGGIRISELSAALYTDKSATFKIREEAVTLFPMCTSKPYHSEYVVSIRQVIRNGHGILIGSAGFIGTAVGTASTLEHVL